MHRNMWCIYVFEISLCIKFQVIGYAEPEGRSSKVSNEAGTILPLHAQYILDTKQNYRNQLLTPNERAVV